MPLSFYLTHFSSLWPKSKNNFVLFMEAKENKKICFRTLLTFKKWKNKRSYLRRLQWHGGEGDLCCPGERCTRSRQPQWWCGIRSWPWRISCWHVHRLSPAEHKKRQRPIRYYTQVESPTMRLRLARCTARVKRWSEAMDFLQNKYLLIAHLWELYYKGYRCRWYDCRLQSMFKVNYSYNRTVMHVWI